MRSLDPDSFAKIIQQAGIKSRLQRELRFITSTSNIPVAEWPELELVAVSDRSGNEGVLLIELNERLYVAPYELSIGISNPQTGRSKPIICDVCYTWQNGGSAARITFTHIASRHKIGFLCCADLACSRHVRGKTTESSLSRTQLHEDLTNEQRVERLKQKLQRILDKIELQPTEINF